MTPGLPNKSQDNAQATKPMICRLNAILAADADDAAATLSSPAARIAFSLQIMGFVACALSWLLFGKPGVIMSSPP